MHIRITFESFYGRIEAIKFVRDITGASLKAAKDAVDSISTIDAGVAGGKYDNNYIHGSFVAAVDAVKVATYLLAHPRLPANVSVASLELPKVVFLLVA